MKGIILAGGSGTRLYPLTKSISKQILPIYDKPMIYYPLSVLMLSKIKDILIISTPRDIVIFEDLLGDGSKLGLNLKYEVQESPAGIGQAFIIGEKFIENDDVALILGDNVFYGQGLTEIMEKAKNKNTGATIFGYYVDNPEDFGVVEFDKDYNVISLEEKPYLPKSSYAVPGLYFYDKNVVEIAKNIKPSSRGELEITSINNEYLRQNKLKVELMGRGITWLDTGTHKTLLQAANFVETIQNRQGLYIACLEEIAYRRGFITKEEVIELAKPLLKNDYGKYLMKIVNM